MKKNILLFIGMLVLSTSSFAGNMLKSSNISLIGGTISPRESLKISTDKLMPEVIYSVICKINDPNNQKNKVILTTNTSNPYVNGKWVGSQFVLTQVDNIIRFDGIYFDFPIVLTNTDQSDSVTVSDCIATPSTN